MKRVAITLLVCLLNTGCSLFVVGARNMIVQPMQCLDDCRSRKTNAALAELAWEKISAEGPYSKDYGRGFRKGYADYLYGGGSGQPPPVPPWRYQTIFYQNPAGYQAILDWYAGYRHGAAAAQAAGFREVIVLPLSTPYPARRSTAWSPAPTEESPTLPPPQQLMPPAEPGAAAAVQPPAGSTWRANPRIHGEP